jgi:hypothetical protein
LGCRLAHWTRNGQKLHEENVLARTILLSDSPGVRAADDINFARRTPGSHNSTGTKAKTTVHVSSDPSILNSQLYLLGSVAANLSSSGSQIRITQSLKRMVFRSVILMMATALLLPSVPVTGSLFPRTLSVSDQQAELQLARFQDEEYLHPEFMHHSEIRSLVEACAEDNSCFTDLSFGDGIYSGCGFFYTEKSGEYCEDETFGKICCGDVNDCCDANVGAIVGISFAVVFVLTLLACSCCYCCKCCCLVSAALSLMVDPYSLNFCILNIVFVASFSLMIQHDKFHPTAEPEQSPPATAAIATPMASSTIDDKPE